MAAAVGFDELLECFNPWYVGGGVKSGKDDLRHANGRRFQSLVCWRGC